MLISRNQLKQTYIPWLARIQVQRKVLKLWTVRKQLTSGERWSIITLHFSKMFFLRRVWNQTQIDWNLDRGKLSKFVGIDFHGEAGSYTLTKITSRWRHQRNSPVEWSPVLNRATCKYRNALCWSRRIWRVRAAVSEVQRCVGKIYFEIYRTSPGMPRAFLIKSRTAFPATKKENASVENNMSDENEQETELSTNFTRGKLCEFLTICRIYPDRKSPDLLIFTCFMLENRT